MKLIYTIVTMVAGRSEIQRLIHENFLVKPDKDKWDCIGCTKQSHEALPDNCAPTFRPTANDMDWRYIVGLAIYRWIGDISLD